MIRSRPCAASNGDWGKAIDLKELYRKDLHRTVLKIVLCLLGFLLILNLVGALTALVAMSIFGPVSVLGFNFWVFQTQGLSSCIALIVGALIFLALRGKRLVTSDLTRVNEPLKVTDGLSIIILLLTIQAVATFLQILYQMIPQTSGSSPFTTYEIAMSGILSSPWGIIYVALIGPIFEELIFRGAIMRSLEHYGANFAIVLSSILFAAYHLILSQAIVVFWIGILLAYVCQRFSIKWSMLLHVLNNCFSLLLIFLAIPALAFLVFEVLVLVGGVLIIVLRRKYLAAEIKSRKPNSLAFALGQPITDVDSLANPASTTVKARPFAVAFTGAALIVALSIALSISTLTMFG